MRRILALICIAIFGVAACSDDSDGGGDEGAYIDALVGEIKDTGDAGFSVSDDDADCLAEQFLDVLGGAETLEAEGITPDDLADAESPADLGLDLGDDDAAAFGSAFADCELPLAELIVESIEETSGEDVSADTQACIDENFDEDAFARLIGQGFATGEDFNQQDPESVAVITDLLTACPELAELGGAGG